MNVLEKMCRCEDECVNKGDACSTCIRNLRNVYRQDNFKLYLPVCKYGYEDCINDPACEKWCNPEWYLNNYGDVMPSVAAKDKNSGCFDCHNGDLYDDEMK